MVRLGSRFFDGYNKEIDNLRRRRKENVDAYNSFIDMKREAGEKASVEELESFKRSISGGDFYFAQGLPASDTIRETSKRLGIQAARTDQEERNDLALDSLKITQQEVATLGQLLSGLEGLDEDKLGDAVTSTLANAGQGKLGEKYAGQIPGLIEQNRSKKISDWVMENGLDKIETKNGMDAMIASAPSWMRPILKSRGDYYIGQANTAKQQAALDSIAQSIPTLAEDAENQEQLRSSVRARLSVLLSTSPDLVTDALVQQAIDQADARFNIVTSKRNRAALSAAEVSQADLIASQGDRAKLEDLAKRALTVALGMTPDAGLIKQYADMLETDAGSAIRTDREAKVQSAVNNVTGLSFEYLDNLDTTQEIDEAIDSILSNAGVDLNSLSEDERAAAVSRVRSALTPLIDAANEDETGKNIISFWNEVKTKEGEIIKAIESGNLADEEATVFDLINSARVSNGLPPYADIASWKADKSNLGSYAWYQSHAKVQAKARHLAERDRIRKTVNANVENTLSTQEADMATRSDIFERTHGEKLGATMKNVAALISGQYYIPTTQRASVINEIERLVKQEEPESSAEVAEIVNRVVASHGLVQQGLASTLLVEEALASEDIIEPGTKAIDYYKTEEKFLLRFVEQEIAKIQNMPMDASPEEVEAAINDLLQNLENGVQAISQNFEDADIQFLLSDMNIDLPQIKAALRGMFAKNEDGTAQDTSLVSRIRGTTPTGVPSFFFKQPGTGLFAVAPDGRSDATQMGFDPNYMYRRLPDGTFEKTQQGVAPSVTDGPTSSNTGLGWANVPGIEQKSMEMSANDRAAIDLRNRILVREQTSQAILPLFENLPENQDPSRGGMFDNTRNIPGWDKPENVERRRVLEALQNFTRSRVSPVAGAGGYMTEDMMNQQIYSAAQEYFYNNPTEIAIFTRDPVAWFYAMGSKAGLN